MSSSLSPTSLARSLPPPTSHSVSKKSDLLRFTCLPGSLLSANQHFALDRCYRHFRLESRAVVPAQSSCHGPLLARSIMLLLRRKSTYPGCSGFRSRLFAARLTMLGEPVLTDAEGGQQTFAESATKIRTRSIPFPDPSASKSFFSGYHRFDIRFPEQTED